MPSNCQQMRWPLGEKADWHGEPSENLISDWLKSKALVLRRLAIGSTGHRPRGSIVSASHSMHLFKYSNVRTFASLYDSPFNFIPIPQIFNIFKRSRLFFSTYLCKYFQNVSLSDSFYAIVLVYRSPLSVLDIQERMSRSSSKGRAV